MTVPFALLVVAASLALGAWALWFVVRDRAVVLRQLWGGAVVVALLLVQAVLLLVRTVQGSGPEAAGELWGYVLTQVLLLPVGGIAPHAMAAYRAAGADGFGIGSAVYKPGMDAQAVGVAAQAFVDAWTGTMRA